MTDDDLGFFAAPRSTTAVEPSPFGTPGPTSEPTVQPEAAARGRRTGLVALTLVLTLAGLAVVGGLAAQAWRSSGEVPPTTVSTPATVGDLVRTTGTAPTLASAARNVTAAVPLRTPLLATYAREAVTAEVLAARPVGRLDLAAQSRVLAAFTRGMELQTEVPPTFVPATAGILSGPFSCSQVDMAGTVRVACVATSSGAVVLILVTGSDYAEATQLAADLRAGVARRG
jgi:hypothetical protein